jgi:peptide deformylase
MPTVTRFGKKSGNEMQKPILKSPDPCVRAKCHDVTAFDDSLAQLSQDLLDSLRASKRPGVGLSSNQIGDLRRVFVMEFAEGTRYTSPMPVFVNPSISKGRMLKAGMEGCLSLEPEDDRRVMRFDIINWKAQDLSGKWHSGKERGFVARVIQHEIDHLSGVLIVDKPKV